VAALVSESGVEGEMAGEEENPKPVGGGGWSWFLLPNRAPAGFGQREWKKTKSCRGRRLFLVAMVRFCL
jgi:hypothetical protein